MMDITAEVWPDKRQRKKEGSHENCDTSQETIAQTPTFSCEVCEVNVNTHHDLEMHLHGRAHLEMVERSEVARRSVFLRGFAVTGSIERDLKELLSQFGSLAMLVVKADKEQSGGSYALAEFLSEEEALKALRCSSPLMLHGKKVVVRPRQLKPVKRRVRFSRKQRLDLGQRCVAPSEMDTGVNEMKMAITPDSIGGIRLTKEAVTAIAAAQSVDAQLQAIATFCCLGDAAANEQLILCSQLQRKFQAAYPKCMVVPFGASISGHGTLSSDCDLCVLTDPLPIERTMFSGPAYYNQKLHSLWMQLEETCPKSNPQPKIAAATTLYHTTFTQTDPSFDQLLAIVKGDTEYEQVLAIANARCPIIRFLYHPLNLHCDLSINNRLGPANTRLMASYFQFDPRMAILVPIVRLWVRAQGIRRSHLNNYAVSLMVIHFLQTVSPPVLPCLQDPGIWPKDMAWIGAKGFFHSQQPLIIDGWKCDFDPPQSFLPSSNTATPAKLFLQFLHYYAACFPFSECAVAIHCCSPPLISQLSQAATHQTISSTGLNTIPSKIAGFKVSALCVQDPFELTHNVAKGMSKSQMSYLLQCFESSHATLMELLSAEMGTGNIKQDVFTVFTQSHMARHNKKPPILRSLSLSLEEISCLLLKTTPYTELAQRLEELDLQNLHIHFMLSCIVLKALTMKLEEEFDFTVCLKTDVRVPPLSTFLAVSPQPSHPHTSIPTDSMEMASCEQQRKRRRTTEKGNKEGVEKVEHKPPCDEEEESEVTNVYESVKRSKMATDKQTAEDLLCHLTEGCGRNVFLCTAVRETWMHCRQQRRERKRVASCSPSSTFDQSISGLRDSLPSPSPCLIFTLSLDEQKPTCGSMYTIKLQATHVKYSQSLLDFFAVFKKWLLHM